MHGGVDKEEDFFRELVHMWIKQAAVQLLDFSMPQCATLALAAGQGFRFAVQVIGKSRPAIPIPQDFFRNW